MVDKKFNSAIMIKVKKDGNYKALASNLKYGERIPWSFLQE